jgi:sec-independent protein translocase protein TatB
MSFFGMGAWEITIILIAALVIFGPDRLPEMAGKLGKQIRDLRQMSSDLTSEFERNSDIQELKKTVQGELSGVKSQVNSVKKDLDKAGSKVSSTVSSAKPSTTKSGDSSSKVSAAKTGTTSTAKSTTAKTTAAKTTAVAKPEPPKASKKDPLADVSFLEEIASAPKPATVAKPAPSTVAAASPVAKSNGASNGTATEADPLAQVDALSRARQRRQAAGYNRRPA